MKTETWDINKLTPYARNPRKNDSAVDKVAASLKEFGWRQPIVVDADGVIIAGHTRYKAARKLGMDKVPVHIADGLTPAQIKAYRIADNKVGELAEWDMELLALEVEDLKLEDYPIDLTGFDLDELPGGSEDVDVDAEPQIDKAEELRVKWGVELGQLWELGEHRLLCGDSTKKEDVERVMGAERAAACVTDPPYGINANKQTLGTGKKQFTRGGDWDVVAPSVKWIIDIADQVVIWGGNYFADQLPPTNDWLCWHKKNDGLSFSEFELAWTTLGKNCRHLSHHWSGEQKDHPTQKPVAVIAWCVKMTSGVVFDPFSGSGTTIIACEQLGRKCRAIEISPAYVAVAIQRWADATGKTPRPIE
jgi:hypothetical protein